jgi:hypothetical protein
MQQFARRQPNEPENDPPRAFDASNEVVAQFMDQVCSLQQHVIALQEEVAGIKSENQRLRSQIAAWVANQEAYLGGKPPQVNTEQPAEVETPEPVVETAQQEPEVVLQVEEAPATEPEPEPMSLSVETAIEDTTVIDEESFIEQARSAEVSAVKPEPTDDEIQRMLAEVAATAHDANQSPIEDVSEPEETPEPEPFLHLAEETSEEPATKVSFEIDREAVKRVPSHLAIAALAVPVRLEGGAVVCKAVAPFDHASLDLIADAIASQVVPEAAPIEEVVAALRIAYNDEQYTEEREEVWAVSGATKKRGLFRRGA